MIRRASAVLAGLLQLALVAALAAQGPPRSPITGPNPKLLSLVRAAREDINKYWSTQISNYRPPVDVVMVQVPAATDCGPFLSPNARYCSSTHKIYWDLSLFDEQFEIGDFAPVFILAHEWGHLVQHLLGINRGVGGLMGIQAELQADCLAGTYANDAKRRGLLDPGDDDEATLALRRAGDRLDGSWFDEHAHGTAGQRIDAFTYGFQGRKCTDDGFFAFLRDHGVDPTRVPHAPVATQGALETRLPKQAGRFSLGDVTRITLDGASDALRAQYKTADGITVQLVLAAFADPTQSAAAFEKTVTEAKGRNAKEIKRWKVIEAGGTNVELGQAAALEAEVEYVVWSNRRLCSLLLGPADVAYELYTALPF